MPEFADPEKRNVFIQDMSSKAKKHYNLTDEQIGTVKTAEEVRILNDALKWQDLQANKGKAQQKAEGARPVVKPAAKRAANSGRVSKAKKAEAAKKWCENPDINLNNINYMINMDMIGRLNDSTKKIVVVGGHSSITVKNYYNIYKLKLLFYSLHLLV